MIDGIRGVTVLEDRRGITTAVLGDTGGLRRQKDSRAAAIGRDPHLRIPCDKPPAFVDTGTQIEQLLRSLRIPDVLVLPRPLHTHRLADCLRDEQCIRRRVIRAVGPIGSGAFHEDDAHLLGRQAEHARQRRAQTVSDLGRCPDGGRVAANVGDGTGRRERGVALAGPEVRRLERRLCGRKRRFESRGDGLTFADRPVRPALHDRLIAIDDSPAQILLEVVVAGEPAPLGPRRLEIASGANGGPLVWRHHGEKAFKTHDASAGYLRDRRLVDADEGRSERRRPNDARVEHVRHDVVLDVLVGAGALRRYVWTQR